MPYPKGETSLCFRRTCLRSKMGEQPIASGEQDEKEEGRDRTTHHAVPRRVHAGHGRIIHVVRHKKATTHDPKKGIPLRSRTGR